MKCEEPNCKSGHTKPAIFLKGVHCDNGPIPLQICFDCHCIWLEREPPPPFVRKERGRPRKSKCRPPTYTNNRRRRQKAMEAES